MWCGGCGQQTEAAVQHAATWGVQGWGYVAMEMAGLPAITGHSFKLESTDILDRETRWWERGVKEAIYERMYNPTLNREGGLRVDLSGTWDLALPAPRTDST
ncbi:hypothetical protein Bbelb_341620 [Branchiostoma belcheri]|nr:hypothetical protein Bbelb_341620 [Branchiostoma belcheri]